jgi:tRNA1Val (adenine37-N6)-methyltransferase
VSQGWDEAVISDHLTLRQRARGYRFGLDALLLATDLPELPEGARVWELGAGQGAVALSVAAREPGWEVVALERHEGLLGLLRHNVEANASGVEVREGDVRERGVLPHATAQLVLCNPPYYKPDSRRVAEDGERAAARHELHGGLGDFARAAAKLLAPRGVFRLVLPPDRLADVMREAAGAGLGVERLRFVHDREGEPAYLCEVGCRKEGRAALEVRAPLVVRGADGRYTEEVARRVAGAAVREPSAELVRRVRAARR